MVKPALAKEKMDAERGTETRGKRGAQDTGRMRARKTELNPIARYFQELRLEWSKVTYPGKKELWQSTLVVFIFSILVTAVIALYDLLVSFILRFLFGV